MGCMSAGAIRAFGIIIFIYEVFLILVVNVARRRNGPLPARALIPVIGICFTATLVGLGLLLLRKWAALFFCSILVALPIWMAFKLGSSGPLGWYLVILAVGFFLLIPVGIVIRSWPLLSWHGKWYF
jgi:hypothetical protein